MLIVFNKETRTEMFYTILKYWTIFNKHFFDLAYQTYHVVYILVNDISLCALSTIIYKCTSVK